MGKSSKQEQLDELEAINRQLQEENSFLRANFYSLEEEIMRLKFEPQSSITKKEEYVNKMLEESKKLIGFVKELQEEIRTKVALLEKLQQ
ncbi:hypothetical protein KI387_036803, partial [Taxus chinensis]